MQYLRLTRPLFLPRTTLATSRTEMKNGRSHPSRAKKATHTDAGSETIDINMMMMMMVVSILPYCTCACLALPNNPCYPLGAPAAPNPEESPWWALWSWGRQAGCFQRASCVLRVVCIMFRYRPRCLNVGVRRPTRAPPAQGGGVTQGLGKRSARVIGSMALAMSQSGDRSSSL